MSAAGDSGSPAGFKDIGKLKKEEQVESRAPL